MSGITTTTGFPPAASVPSCLTASEEVQKKNRANPYPDFISTTVSFVERGGLLYIKEEGSNKPQSNYVHPPLFNSANTSEKVTQVFNSATANNENKIVRFEESDWTLTVYPPGTPMPCSDNKSPEVTPDCSPVPSRKEIQPNTKIRELLLELNEWVEKKSELEDLLNRLIEVEKSTSAESTLSESNCTQIGIQEDDQAVVKYQILSSGQEIKRIQKELVKQMNPDYVPSDDTKAAEKPRSSVRELSDLLSRRNPRIEGAVDRAELNELNQKYPGYLSDPGYAGDSRLLAFEGGEREISSGYDTEDA